jgi:hypothetical protein
MKRHVVCVLALLLCSACSQAPSTNNPTAPSPAGGSSLTGSATSVPVNYRAHLSGEQIVPPLPVATLAQGQAIFQLSPDGSELSYRVIASNIDNVTAVHLHLGAPGLRGPLVAFLFGPVPPGGGRTDGVLATGTITAANIFGPTTFSAVIAAIEAGNAYLDVPTNDGVGLVNTGPGDFVAGEIRGQLH